MTLLHNLLENVFLGKMYDEGYISLKWIQPGHLAYNKNAMGTVDINLLI